MVCKGPLVLSTNLLHILQVGPLRNREGSGRGGGRGGGGGQGPSLVLSVVAERGWLELGWIL